MPTEKCQMWHFLASVYLDRLWWQDSCFYTRVALYRCPEDDAISPWSLLYTESTRPQGWRAELGKGSIQSRKLMLWWCQLHFSEMSGHSWCLLRTSTQMLQLALDKQLGDGWMDLHTNAYHSFEEGHDENKGCRWLYGQALPPLLHDYRARG